MNARRFIQRLAVTIQAVTIVLSLGGCAAPTLQVAAAPAAPASAPAAPASAPASRQDGGTLSSSLERCEQPLGSLSLREDENSSWFVQLRSKQLGSTLPMLRRLIEQSNCFVVIERDRIPADRALAGGPGTLGMGPKQAADFTLSPSVQFASTGRSWVPGFFGGGFGALAGGLASADASTTLLLVDNRSGVQVAAAESSSHRADLDQNGLDNRVLAAAGSDYGRTIEGKVVLAAFADSYNKTVKSLRRYQETMLQGRLSTGMQVNAGLTAEPLRPYVNFDAPRSTRAAQKVAVQIWLSRRGETPEARVQAQGSQQPDPQGRLELRLPRDRRNWTIRVVMIAPGFDFEPGSSNVATLQLTDEQTSDTAGFFLLARDDQVGEQSLRATLWHEGAYLGSVTRDIRIEAVAKDVGRSTTNVPGAASGIAGLAPGGPASTVGRALLAPPNSAPADPALDAQRGELPAPRPTSADLTVYVRHENPLALGRVAVIVSSPHLQGPPTTESYQYPSDTARWLAAWIDRLQRLHATRDAQAAARNVDMLRGLGVELYQRLAPPGSRAHWPVF